MPQDATGGTMSDVNWLVCAVTDPETRRQTVFSDLPAGGWGGMNDMDGASVRFDPTGNCMNLSAEVAELCYPIVYEAFDLRQGFGGSRHPPGRARRQAAVPLQRERRAQHRDLPDPRGQPRRGGRAGKQGAAALQAPARRLRRGDRRSGGRRLVAQPAACRLSIRAGRGLPHRDRWRRRLGRSHGPTGGAGTRRRARRTTSRSTRRGPPTAW